MDPSVGRDLLSEVRLADTSGAGGLCHFPTLGPGSWAGPPWLAVCGQQHGRGWVLPGPPGYHPKMLLGMSEAPETYEDSSYKVMGRSSKKGCYDVISQFVFSPKKLWMTFSQQV